MLLNNYLSGRCWQSGFFKCSLQVWRCWSPGSAKASVKNSSSLKPLINDRQVSIHAWHFMQVQSKTICRMVGNSIRLWASTEAQHTCPGKWQRDRHRGDGELYCLAQGVEKKMIWQKLGSSWVFWEWGKELAHSSFISDPAAVAVSPRDPFGQSEGVGRVTELTAKQVRQPSVEGWRSNVLITLLAQTELWGCMTKFSGHSCHTRSLSLGKYIYIFA